MDSSPCSPRFADLLRGLALATAADGVTLWRAEARELVAVANPLEPEIVGLRQRLDAGVISQVYLTGQAILAEDLTAHPAYDPTIARMVGRPLRGMMAAPVDAGEAGGVVSAVKFGDSGTFSFTDLGTLTAAARELGQACKEAGW